MNNGAKDVAIVILNWNGWRDTIECLEVLFQSQYSNFRVVVCDNASTDGSLDHIQAWAEGTETAVIGTDFSRLCTEKIEKPVSHIRLSAEKLVDPSLKWSDVPLTLIETGGNLGFAGGNNVGIRYALKHEQFDYFWLLNNDTVVEQDALAKLVERMSTDTNVGICGSTLLHYYAPHLIQVAGGSSYNAVRCRAHPLLADRPASEVIDPRKIESQLAYIAGASMMVHRAFLRDIGLMAEDYFLYYEEFDWACRSAGKYTLAYAKDSLVYHKEGGSIGTGARGKVSALAIYYLQSNRIKFTRRFFPSHVPFLYLNMLLEVVRTAVRRDFFEVKWMLIAMFGGKPPTLAQRKRRP